MQLLQDLNPLTPGGYDMTPVLIITGIWAAVGLAFFVWYLWSLSKLFPLLGIKGAWGWIPVWNQWQLIQRGGLPGWLVLLLLVPGLGALVVLVVMIVAIHRINTEFGKGGGMTVLGVLLAPLWAMLLTSHITDGRYGAAAEWAPAREDAGVDAAAAGGAGVAAPQGLPYAHLTPQQPAPGYAPQPAAPGYGQQPGMAGYAPQPGYTQQAPEHFGYEQQSTDTSTTVRPQRSVFAPPASGAVQQSAQAAQSAPEAHAPQSPQSQLPPQAQQGQLSQPGQPGQPGQPAAFEQPAQPAAPQPVAPQPAAPVAADVPAASSQPHNDWGFSNTTEGAYERLAAEGTQAPVSAPLGAPVLQQPFSWPAPQAEDAAPSIFDAAEAQHAAPVAQAPLRMATAPEQPAEGAVPPAAPAAPVPPAPVAPAPVAPQQPDAEPVAAQNPAFLRTPATAQPPVAPETLEAAQPGAPTHEHFDDSASYSRTGPSSTAPVSRAHLGGEAADPAFLAAAGAVPVAPIAPASAAPGPTGAPADDEFEDDHTVVVRRETRWGLELPDGEVLELLGHDVVVGRRPEPAGAYEVLTINDPTRTLSKSHVRMRRTGEAWTVEDLHSTNGVALIDETGATIALDAGHERGTTERMLIGTLEVRLVRVS